LSSDHDHGRRLRAAELRRESPRPAAHSHRLTPRSLPPGQERALAALDFALTSGRPDFHAYLVGLPGAGRHALLTTRLRRWAATRPPARDLCYVPRFEDPQRPRLIALPAGEGTRLRAAVEGLLRRAVREIPALLVAPDYLARRRRLLRVWQDKREALLAPVKESARRAGLSLEEDEQRFYFLPLRDGVPVSEEAFRQWPHADQVRVREAMARLAAMLEAVEDHFPALERGRAQALRRLLRTRLRRALDAWCEAVAQDWSDQAEAAVYLRALGGALAEEALIRWERGEVWNGEEDGPFDEWRRRFGVHVFVARDPRHGAPVVYEERPTARRLLGKVQFRSGPGGQLERDHHLLCPGALVRADGGVLVVDAERLLEAPHAWERLKQALASGRVALSAQVPGEATPGTPVLYPDPIPLRVLVVLVGTPATLEALQAADPDFPALFRILVDLADDIPRDREGEMEYARWIRHLLDEDGLRPFTGEALARVLETAARWSGEATRLWVHRGRLRELLVEADHQAGPAPRVEGRHVRAALAAREARHGRLRERLLEDMVRGALRVETEGACVGQVNGLTVIDTFDATFGQPVRITARVWPGDGEITDIEREVALSGPIHDKGVLILHGFLAQRYARRHGLPLAASIVFEQSYSEIEGDSASSAELYALLSALSGLPLRQDLAVTGAVDHHGRLLAVGDVNHKIEGFFALCRARGPLRGQGVIIPAANVPHLMLDEAVVAAVAAGHFHIHAIDHVDQGLRLLTGVDVGRPDRHGDYPPDTIDGRILATLEDFAHKVERRHPHGDEA